VVRAVRVAPLREELLRASDALALSGLNTVLALVGITGLRSEPDRRADLQTLSQHDTDRSASLRLEIYTRRAREKYWNPPFD
jgi:hypothetical protein